MNDQLKTIEMLRNWYCWVYWIEIDTKKYFLYGYLAQSMLSEIYIGSDEPIHITDDIFLKVKKVNQELFETLQQSLNMDGFGLDIIDEKLGDLYVSNIKGKINDIRDVVGNSAVPVTTWHTCGSLIDLIPDTQKYYSILEELQHETSLDFTGPYAGLVGAFEKFDLPVWAEDIEYPFQDFYPDILELNKRSKIIFKRHFDYIIPTYYVSLCLYNNEYMIHNKLHTWKSGEQTLGPIDTFEHFNSIICNIYTESGDVIHRIEHDYVDTISMGISLGHNQIVFNDNSLSGVPDKVLVKKYNQVVKHSTGVSSSIDPFRDKSSIREYFYQQRRMVKTIKEFVKNSESRISDKWFNKGIEAKLTSILYIKGIIEQHLVNRALIIDPYFDINALKDLVIRIGKTNLHLIIMISSKLDTSDQENRDIWKELEVVSPQLKEIINCKLDIYNILDPNQNYSRAFHDRYLATYHDNEMQAIYMLSNSINAVSKNYPFCISMLNQPALKEVDVYLQKFIEIAENKINPFEILHWCNYE